MWGKVNEGMMLYYNYKTCSNYFLPRHEFVIFFRKLHNWPVVGLWSAPCLLL